MVGTTGPRVDGMERGETGRAYLTEDRNYQGRSFYRSITAAGQCRTGVVIPLGRFDPPRTFLRCLPG